MSSPSARQPLAGWRNEACLIPIRVPGVDLTGKALRAQIRQTGDNPVLTLDMPATADAAATGIRLVSVSVDAAGIPTSNLMWQVTKAAMQGLPFAGEIGDPWVGSYALQIDGRTRMFGPFGALASPIDSDGAPANRPPAGFGGGVDFGSSSGVTLTIGTDGVTVAIDGAGLLAALITAAQAQADRAAAFAAAAATSAASANAHDLASAAQAVAAALSAGKADGSAARATQASVTAGAIQAAIIALLAGTAISAVLQLQAVSRDLMAAMTETADGRQLHLSEVGAIGDFNMLPAAIDAATTARVTADVNRALYVKQTAAGPGNGRVWARAITRREYHAAWALGAGSAFTDANVPIKRLLDLMEPYSTLILPRADMGFSSTVESIVPGLTLLSAPGHGSFIYAQDKDAQGNSLAPTWEFGDLWVMRCSDVTVDGVRWQHQYTQAVAGGGFCIQFTNNDADPAKTLGYQQSNVTYRNGIFQNCTEAVVCYGNNRNPGNANYPGGYETDPAKFYRVKGVHGHDNLFDGLAYQAMSLFGCEDVDLHDFSVRMGDRVHPGFTPNIRILGSKNVRLHDFYLRGTGITPYANGDTRSYGVAFMSMLSRGTRLMNEGVSVTDFQIENSRYPFNLDECAGTLLLADGVVTNDITSAEATALLLMGQAPTDLWSPLGNNVDDLVIRNIRARGMANGPNLQGRIGSVEMSGCKLIGNARPADATTRAFVMQGNAAWRLQAARIAHNEFLLPDGGGNVPIEINNIGAGGLSSASDFFEVVGNTVPAGAHAQGLAYFAGYGSNRTQKGTAPVANAGSAATGSNDQFPAGHFNRMLTGAA